MTLDPKTAMILNTIYFAVSSLVGAVWLSGAIPDHYAALTMGLLSWLCGILNFVLHAYSPAVAGPLAQSQPGASPPKAVIAVFVCLLATLLMLSAGTANAQQPAHLKRTSTSVKVAAVTALAKTAPAKLTTVQVQQNPLLLLQQFTVSDLQAALADAQAQTPPDTAAATCYQALIVVVQSNVANPLPAGPGIFQALQKARDAKALLANLQSATGPLASLNTACAPIVLDAQNTLLTLGVSVGLVANPVGASATLAGLPAAIIAFLGLPKL